MKRSEVNRLMREAWAFFDLHRFRLPAWASWSPEQWRAAGPECAEVARHGLGWDITDFGGGDFPRLGLLLFTIRNGQPGNPATKPYCEKIMIVRQGQLTPYHYHRAKVEDIINRGGGNLVIEVANSAPDGGLADTPVTVSVDGVSRTVPARGRIILTPGESITLPQLLYHAFWGEEDKGHVLVGEVSAVNDDAADNFFLEPVGRFPAIEEDEPALHPLCTEYPAHLVA